MRLTGTALHDGHKGIYHEKVAFVPLRLVPAVDHPVAFFRAWKEEEGREGGREVGGK